MRRNFQGMPLAARQVIARAREEAVRERAQEAVASLLGEEARQIAEVGAAVNLAIDVVRPSTSDTMTIARAALEAARTVRLGHTPVAPRIASARARLLRVTDAVNRRKLVWLRTRHPIEIGTPEQINAPERRVPVFGEGVGVRKVRRGRKQGAQ